MKKQGRSVEKNNTVPYRMQVNPESEAVARAVMPLKDAGITSQTFCPK
jgi:hypothetical protein